MSSLFRKTFGERKHRKYDVIAYFMQVYLGNGETYLIHITETCDEKFLRDFKKDIENTPQAELVAVFQFGDRIKEYYRLKNIFIVVAYNEGDEQDCLMLIHDKDSTQKIFFKKKDVVDFVDIKSIKREIEHCEYGEEILKQEPQKKGIFNKKLYMDKTLQEVLL